MQSDREASKVVELVVVGVGVSAGGLEALKLLLDVLPADTGMAYILVQHLDPAHPSLLPELLRKCTDMPVLEAEQGLVLEPNQIYVIPPDVDLAVGNGHLDLRHGKTYSGVRLPIDYLFRSLAGQHGARAIGVVLSGTGSDGTAGLRAIRAAGGLTLAQTPATAAQPSMPQAAIDAGVVDLTLPIAEMPSALTRFAATAQVLADESQREAPALTLDERDVAQLAEVLSSQNALDVRSYKIGTLARRVFRRMALTGDQEFDGYMRRLVDDPDERTALLRDVLIGVTEFFRDPDAFAFLRDTVFPSMVQTNAEAIRVWVAGCATGEEAYSVGIELLEALEAQGLRVPLRVFATDIDLTALATARRGVYSRRELKGVSDDRLHKYFKALDDDTWQIRGPLRDSMSFAVHDLTTDPPFSRMDLVTCRNVLIYLRPEAQSHLLQMFHFALRDNGCLLLGPSESLGSNQDLFLTLSKKWLVFRKDPSGRSNIVWRPRRSGRSTVDHREAVEVDDRKRDLAARDALLAARTPPSLIVSESGAVLYMYGELRPYLRFPSGEARLDLAEIMDPDLRTRTRAAIYKCRREQAQVMVVSSPDGERTSRVRITADPVPSMGDGVVLLSFEEISLPPHTEGVGQGDADAAVQALESELAATRDDLQTTVAELETANEGSTSMNEEFQATNEELEAISEELRSLNEELTTVNSQLREKVEQVEQAHDDLSNFFSSAKIATIFLDLELRIMRLTPTARELLRIDHSDVGRFVGDLAREPLQNGLAAEARQVLDQLRPIETEIRLDDGRHLSRRVLPYLTESRRIEGVVVTFTDVTESRLTAARLLRRERQSAVIARLGLRALDDEDLGGFMDQVAREVAQTLDTEYANILELQPGGRVLVLRAGVGWTAGLAGHACVDAGSDSQAGYTLTTSSAVIVQDLATEKRFPGPQLLLDHGVVSGLSCVIRDSAGPYGVLGAHTADEREFTVEDANFLQSVASILAAAISRRLSNLRLAFEGVIDREVVTASDLEVVIGRVHQSFNRGDARLSELWTPGDDERLVRTYCKHSGGLRSGDIEAALPGASDGLIDRVAQSRRAEWFTALQPPAGLSRIAGLEKLGLPGGVAIPIIAGDRVLGVVAFNSSDASFLDQPMLRSLESMGRTMGDFVQRRAAELATEAIDRRYRSTFESAAVGIGEVDLEGRWLRVNGQLTQITGYRKEALLATSFQAITHPDDLEADREQLDRLLKKQIDRYSMEKRYVRPDGSIVRVHVTATLERSAEGEPGYMVAVVEDITARVEAEAAQRASDERFRRVLMNSPVPVFVYDESGRITAASRSFHACFGFEEEDLLTIDAWIERAFTDDAAAARAFFKATERHAKGETLEVLGRARDGSLRALRISCAGLSADGGMFLCVAADVTEQRSTRDALLEASQQKDDFLALLGHELRNPLAAIQTAARLLALKAPTDPTIARTHAVLERQTVHMTKLLDGLLDVSRIIRGKVELDRRPVDLAQTLRLAIETLSGRVEERRLEVELEAPEAGVWVSADPVRMSQVLDNLLSNAIKFTPQGGRIDCAVRRDGDTASVTVRDSGDGIGAELLPYIFDAFRQADQTLDRAPGGLGLGLALVKSLVELHGGQIRARSDGHGDGSEFELRMEAIGPPPHVTTPPPIERPSDGPIRILVIEDNVDLADLLGQILEIEGHQVTLTADGREGLDLVRREHFDVILCDIGLPGFSGFEVARALNDDADRRRYRLVALTGYGRPEDRERSLAAGFDDHLTKPVDMDLLGRLIRASR